MRRKGKITNWDDDKGFGFIIPNSGEKKVFAHIKSFSNRKRRPLENEVVSYKLKTDNNGRENAESIKFKWDRVRTVSSFTRHNISLIFVVSYFAFLAGAAYIGRIPYNVLWFYCGASVVTFLVYVLDKSAAQKEKWRTQENTLHFFALIGGWPGALSAQKLIRHKSSKRSFKLMFWVTVFLNCGALGLFLTS